MRFLPDIDEAAVTRGFFVLVTDLTNSHNVQAALQAANAKLSNETTSDQLTGLTNRLTFSERGEEAARRFKKNADTYGLILLDVDNFKEATITAAMMPRMPCCARSASI